MPLLDMSKPEMIRFHTEYLEKCLRLKMKWNYLNADKVKEASTLLRKETFYTTEDVLKSTMVAEMANIARDHVTNACNRRRKPDRDCTTLIPGAEQLKKGHTIVDFNLGDHDEDPRLARPDTDTSFDPVMRVVDPEQKSIIYKNVPDFGRANYLKNRSRMLPEDKYYFPECSSWDYGWRLKDSDLSRNRPSYGREWTFNRSSKSRSGPHPDPAYYRHPDINDVVKCSK